MAYTPVLIDGFEHGVLDSAGEGIVQIVTGAVSISTTTARSGNRSLRINPAGGQSQYEYATFAASNLWEGHIAVRFATLPNSTVTLFELLDQAGGGDRAQIVLQTPSNTLLIGVGGNWLETPLVSIDQWYAIEFAFDSASTTWSSYAKVRIENGDIFYSNQRSDSKAGAQNMSDVVIGALNNVTADYFLDDLVVASGSVAEHPVGSVAILRSVPGGVGTHNFDAATSAYFFKDIAAAETALTTSETTSHEVIDDVPIDADADHILVRAVTGVFPTIPTVAGGRVLTTNIDGTGTRTFPSLTGLTKNAGDLLIAIIVAYQSSSGAGAPGGSVFSSWGAGFTEFCDQMTTNSSTMAIGAAYKISTGSETGTFTVTQAATITGGASLILLSIPGAHGSTAPEAGTIANGTTGAADPGSFNPSGWDVEETLWIAVGCNGMTASGGTWTAMGASAPTNYTDFVDTNRADDSTVGRVEGAVAFRQNAAASEDPGTFSGTDISNARNSALVIAVRPAVTTAQPTNTWYTEHTIANSPGTGDPKWVRAIVNLSQDSVVACDITAKLREGTNEENIYTGVIGTTSSFYKSKLFTQRPNSGGVWTQAAFDALVARWGYTADADGTPRLRAIMLEAAYDHVFPVPAFTPPLTMPQYRPFEQRGRRW